MTPFRNRLFLARLAADAVQKGFYLPLKLFLYWLCFPAYALFLVGFFGTFFTLGRRMYLGLMVLPVFAVVFGAELLCFLPDLVCLPSERRRYRL